MKDKFFKAFNIGLKLLIVVLVAFAIYRYSQDNDKTTQESAKEAYQEAYQDGYGTGTREGYNLGFQKAVMDVCDNVPREDITAIWSKDFLDKELSGGEPVDIMP